MVYKRGAEVLNLSTYYQLLAVTGASSEGFVWNPGTRIHNEFNEFESSLRCAPDWNSHWLRPNVAPQAPWRGAQARRQGVICDDSRCDGRLITSYSCPGSTAGWSSRPCQEPICLHLLKTSQRLKLLANYGRLFIFWWQSLESICGKESLCFLLTGAWGWH